MEKCVGSRQAGKARHGREGKIDAEEEFDPQPVSDDGVLAGLGWQNVNALSCPEALFFFSPSPPLCLGRLTTSVLSLAAVGHPRQG